MVATSQTCATQVGVETLKAGGSAVDAAIAANAMLSLAEPHMCGPGGDLFAIVWDPREWKLHGLNASGRSPAAQTLAMLRQRLGEERTMPGRGPLAVTSPGAVDGWCVLHERFGRLPFAKLFEPVSRAARLGVPIGSRTAEMWSQAAHDLLEDPVLDGVTDEFRQTFLIEHNSPLAGQVFHNPNLANTYERIASDGRKGFYEGEFAADFIANLAALGVAFSAADLARSHADWVAPLTTTYRGFDVHELPPNGQGICVLQMLNILESFPLQDFGLASPDYWHAFIEAKKLSFEDRARYFADPQFADVPAAALCSKDYANQRRAEIDPQAAGGAYSYGHVQVPGSDTTYLCAADGDGMMVSLIQSIFSPFGSGLVVPGTGFALQCRGAGFNLDPRHPNHYAPAKRPFHTIIPGFVTRDGKPCLSFGVMGADMQPQGQVQTLVNQIDFGLDLQAAGDAPRMRHFGGSQPNGLTLDAIGTVHYEAQMPAALIEELRRRGHRLEPITDWITSFVGGYQAIRFDHDHGVYIGASESRFDGSALGY